MRASGQLFNDMTRNSPHAFTCIVDSGCSRSATNTFADVDPDSIKMLDKPLILGGIAGKLEVQYVGTANWETLDDDGNIVPFTEEVMIHPGLPDRLLSPQSFLSNRKGCVDDHFKVFRDRAEWHKDGRKLLTMDYDNMFLPRMILFSKGESIPTLSAMVSVLDSSNRNMNPLQKIWLRWHTKLGHISFSHVQKLAVGGLLDKLALGLVRCTGNSHPKCAACQYGKQTRTPDPLITPPPPPPPRTLMSLEASRKASSSQVIACSVTTLSLHIKGASSTPPDVSPNPTSSAGP
jgi:hypothetical protein